LYECLVDFVLQKFLKISIDYFNLCEKYASVCHIVVARAAYGELDSSEGRRLRKRPEPKETPPAKKASPVSFARCFSVLSAFQGMVSWL